MALVLASALRSRMPGRAKGLAMDILAHALTELNSGRLPAFCAKFKVSFSAGSADDAGDASRPHLDDSRRDPCVVIENVMEESVGPQRRASDPLSAVGDCLLRSSTRKKSETRANSIVLSTARRLCRRGSGGSPYAEGHLDANASPLKDSRDKAHFDKGAGAQHGEPLQLDPAGTSGSLESVRDHEPLCSHRDYVLHSQAVFETYWKGNLHNILDVLKELTDRGSAELGWKRQGKLHEFTKAEFVSANQRAFNIFFTVSAFRCSTTLQAVTRVWQRVGEQVSTNASEVLSHLENHQSNAPSRPDFLAHELLPLLLRMREVWWITQRHVAGNFLALYQKYDGASDQWLMSLREVDVHLLRTAIVHREIMECELQKVLRAADRELASSCCCLHEIFVKEGIGYWLAEHLDLIWSEFGNQVQKGVVNLHKAFDSSYLRAWASSLDANADEVAQSIHSAWTAFIGRVQESRRYVVEEETTRNARQDDMDMDTSSIPQRIYIYTSILRRYEELANHDWQVTYRSTIAILDQALSGGAVGGLSGACLSAVPVAHTKVMVIVTKIWEEVMVEIRQAFKECREKFEEAILVDHGL
ncbi:uncharacterized protein LOC125944182 [Dermacentor silvarum]|uniref:uncharacterized protein LOC125944182 n=1 Tax=Dermacentor silvarum TaxID=543639 RepID=UPI00210119A9|nr:uncharacterized protein LOC125944182 [Dermacentor silvarum]